MAYDEELAERVRQTLASEPAISEKRMFGGLAFLADGRMAVGATSEGLMVRVDRDESEALTGRPHVERMRMGDREMKGWLLVAVEAMPTADDLAAWVDRGLAAARAAG